MVDVYGLCIHFDPGHLVFIILLNMLSGLSRSFGLWFQRRWRTHGSHGVWLVPGLGGSFPALEGGVLSSSFFTVLWSLC